MRVLQINIVFGHGSTGVIVKLIADMLVANGDEAFFAFDGSDSRHYTNAFPIGNKWTYRLHAHLFSKCLDKEGFGSFWATKSLCKWIDTIKPDVIHLHNIHGSYINISLLFEYINNRRIPVVITLHDCWMMTGHCYHFDSIGCDRWRTGCYKCPLHGIYPVSIGPDRSQLNFLKKERIFTSVERLHIVSVSKFIDNVVSNSYLNKYPHSVIYNGVNLDVFKPIQSDMRENICAPGKTVVLGVSSGWSNQKGLKEMINLSKNNEIQVIMIGVQKSLKDHLPKEIIAIEKTDSQRSLAEYYSLADVFVNPTYNDSFPTVNIEALACGTPVVTYRTGGSPEAIDAKTGIVVERGDVNGLQEAVFKIMANNRNLISESCVLRARNFFNQRVSYRPYLKIYKELYD